MRKIKLLLLLIVLILVFFSQWEKGQRSAIVKKLKALSLDERKCLEFFFRDAFIFDGLGYTLFGDKPLTTAGYYESKGQCRDVNDFYDSTFSSFSAENLRARRGYEILKKY